MKHSVSRELYRYWDELRGARAAPERCDIDPAAIRGILADTFVLEVDEPGAVMHRFPFRLSGTRLNALFLAELKGRSLLALWRPTDRRVVEDILSCVLDERAAMVASVKAAPRENPPIDLEMLLLPLRHHGKTHARILGSLAPTVLPSWIGLSPVEPMTLASFRHVVAPDTPGGRASLLPAEILAPPPRRHGRFTIYDGGR